MIKKVFTSTQFNPKEIKFLDEVCKIENRSRSNFLYVSAIKRAERIFESLGKELPDLSDEEETTEEDLIESQEEIDDKKDFYEVEE